MGSPKTYKEKNNKKHSYLTAGVTLCLWLVISSSPEPAFWVSSRTATCRLSFKVDTVFLGIPQQVAVKVATVTLKLKFNFYIDGVRKFAGFFMCTVRTPYKKIVKLNHVRYQQLSIDSSGASRQNSVSVLFYFHLLK